MVGVRGILSLGIDLMSNVVSLLSFITILWTLSGPLTVFGCHDQRLHGVGGADLFHRRHLATHFVGRPLAILNFRKQRVEADFRFSLVRLRENTEGVALYGGEEEEKSGLLARFEALVATGCC